MSDLFQIDQRELKSLLKFYKHAPRKFNAAAAGMLNSFAFGTKHEAEKKINENLTVRNPAFVKSSIRVNKTRIGNMNTMQSQTYSVKRPRFSGWIEQETGQATTRKRVQTLAARQDNWKNKLPSSARMKSSNTFHQDEDFASKYAHTRDQRTVAMLQSIRSGKTKNKPIIIRRRLQGRLQSMKPGTYRMQSSGRFAIEQVFRPKNKQPRLRPWMKPARQKYFSTVDMNNLWRIQLDRILK